MKSIRAFIVLSSLLSGFSLKSQILYSNNFATSLGTATASGGASGNWLWNNTCAQVNTVGHSIGGVATFSGSSCQYGNGGNTVSGNLTTAPVSIGSSGAVLTFNYFLNTECQNAGGTCYYDVLTLQISNNGGTTWTNIMASNGPPLGLVHTTAWQPIVYSLNTYSNQTVLIRFNFNSIDGIGNAYDGVYVDDIIVTSNCFISLTSLPGNSTVTPVICAGQSLTLTTNAVSNYSWSSGATTQSIVVSPTVSTQYSIVATSSANCSSSNTLSVIVNALPVISVNNGTICAGQSFTISPNGANTYTIQGGNAIVSPSINTTYTVAGTSTAGCVSQALITSSLIVNPNPIITVNNGTICAGQNFTINPNGANTYTIQGGNAIVSPSINTTYTVAGTSTAGCVSQAFTTFSLSVNPNPIITVNNGTICAGQSFTINPIGASTYTIQGGNAVVNPSASSSYTVRGTSAAGCLSANTTTSNVTVNANPTITVNSGAICAGQPFTLLPAGANTYTIQGGNATVNPGTTSSYTLIGTSAVGCVSQGFATSTITVNPNPTITVNSGSICAGQIFSINPNGASTYTIQGGNAAVSPSSNSSYTVMGTSALGCISQVPANSSVVVNVNPTITVNSGAICAGQSFTINPAGANTYTIQGGNAIVNPAINTTYTIAGTSAAGCVSQAFTTSSLTVNPNPIITVNNGTVCAGQIFLITPNGANTYTIQGGNAAVSPSLNTTYTVAGTSAAGCVSQAFVTSSVTVNPNPTITIASGTICAGQSYTLVPNGASTYVLQGANTVVNPTSNTSYTVRGTSAEGCLSANTATSNVTVNANPTITVNSGSICAGQTFTINPAGANTFTIQGGNAVVSPSINTTYTVAGTSTAGCVSQAFTTSSLTVNANPTITVNNGAICAGQSFTINPAGANTYTLQGANAVVSPSINSTYTVMGTNTLTGCRSQSFATSNLTVNPNPTVSITGASGICTGQNASLTANGAPSYTWSTGSTNTSIVTTPTTNTTYTLTGSTPQGCSSFTTQLVTVQASLSVSIAGPTSVCYGQAANLSGLGGVTYTWNTAATTASIAPILTTTTTFTVIGVSGSCSNTAIRTISVNPNPTISITGTTAICSGSSASLTVNGATTYTWSTLSTNTSVVVSPSATTVYSVVGSFSTGCAQLAAQTVSVYALPVVSISGPSVVCVGGSITLNANGAATYVWDNTATTASIVVSPSATASYSAVGTDTNGCNASASTSVTANPVPVMSVVKTTSAVCQGDSLSFTATGANSYSWSTGAITNSIVVTPTSSATYSVVGTNTFGCISLLTDSVKVNAVPVLTITGNTGTICVGETLVLNLNGAATYSWSTGASTSSISVSPSIASTYSATGTSTDACVSAITTSVQVSECTGLNAYTSATSVKVYPNPTNGEFTLELSSVNKSVITITTILGQVVLSQEAGLFQQINLSELNKGLYFINVTENNKSVYRTNIVKQ